MFLCFNYKETIPYMKILCFLVHKMSKRPAPECIATRKFEPSRIYGLTGFLKASSRVNAGTNEGEAPATLLHFGLPYR